MALISQVYKLNTHELARRAGEMKEYELDIEAPTKVGVDLIHVPAGEVIEVDARLESVTEGILLTADIFALVKGECTRCLDPIEMAIERKVQELYYYAQKSDRSKRKKERDEDDLDIDEELMMEGDIMDLEGPIRDAIVLLYLLIPYVVMTAQAYVSSAGANGQNFPRITLMRLSMPAGPVFQA